MQHVSTYGSHLQAKLRTVIALQGGNHLTKLKTRRNRPINRKQKHTEVQVDEKEPTPTPFQQTAPKAKEQRTQVVLHTPHT